MPNLWLTNEPADISGYRRAKLGQRSDAISLVRTTLDTQANPSTPLSLQQWITDPLDGTVFTASNWILHAWANQSDSTANCGLRLQVLRFTGEESTTLLNDLTNLTTVMKDLNYSTMVSATPMTTDPGERLVIKLALDNSSASSMLPDFTATLSYNGFYPRAEGDSYIVCPDAISLMDETPVETIASVRQLLQDVSETNPLLTDADLSKAFQDALVEYSVVNPYMAMEFYNGDGHTYQFTLPRLWVNGLSSILSVEYPTGFNPKSMLKKEDDWGIVDSWLGVQPTKNVWITEIPEAGTNNILLAYTTNHIHNVQFSTIPELDFTPVLWLAASFSARMLSSRAAGHTDPTIVADSANYRDEATRWKDIAQQYYVLYANHVLQPVVGEVSASGRQDWDTFLSSGRDFIWHRRRFR